MGEESQLGTETVWRSTSSSEGALSISEAEENPYFDFISILALAQRLDIDFLPISWKPAPRTVGELPTAEFLQALISMQTKFAFKRVKGGLEIRSKAHKSKEYQRMYSEILALGQPEIRQHPNVVRLEGLCWDVLPDNKEVRPVLAFEKAGFGSLTEWSASSEGKTAAHSVRLRLCADVANAVRHLHVNRGYLAFLSVLKPAYLATDVIHGDIKPDHVLIFKDESNNLVAKVAGFGSSTMFTSQSTVHMSKSSHWTAPEWHHRGFAPSNAKKMDIYSLGVLSLWLMVYETQDHGIQPFSEWLDSRIHALWDLKGTTVETSEMSDKEQRDLVEFFAATLSLDPSTRTSDLTECISLLTQKP